MPQERSHEPRNIPVSSHSWETWKRSAGSRRQRRKASNKNSHTVLFAKSYHYKFPYASKETSRVLKNRGQSARTASGAIRLHRLHRIDAIRFDGMIAYPMRWSRRLGNQWARPCRGVEEIFMTCFLLLAMNCLCGIPMPQKEFNSIWRPRNNRGWVNLTIPVGQPNHTTAS